MLAETDPPSPQTLKGKLVLHLMLHLCNSSSVRAQNFCLLVHSNAIISGTQNDSALVKQRLSGYQGTSYLEFQYPLYPEMVTPARIQLMFETYISSETPGGPLQMSIGGDHYSEINLFTKLYADNAPLVEQEFQLKALDSAHHVEGEITRAVRIYGRR
jgi:hypothetical protein